MYMGSSHLDSAHHRARAWQFGLGSMWEALKSCGFLVCGSVCVCMRSVFSSYCIYSCNWEDGFGEEWHALTSEYIYIYKKLCVYVCIYIIICQRPRFGDHGGRGAYDWLEELRIICSD
jgi:hypothetical protein